MGDYLDHVEVQTFFPQAERIIAIGDVHGDVTSLRSCLLMAKLIDANDTWVGGNTHLVQASVPPHVVREMGVIHLSIPTCSKKTYLDPPLPMPRRW